MARHHPAAGGGLGLAPAQRVGVGALEACEQRGVAEHGLGRRHAGLRNARCPAQHAAPFFLQVDAAVQLGRHDVDRKRMALAQRHRHRRLGQQRVIGTAHDEQLHRVQRRGHVAQHDVLADLQPLARRQQPEHDVGHVAAKRHHHFLAAEVGQRAQALLARDHPQQAPGADVEQPQRHAAVVEVGRDVARHRDEVGRLLDGLGAQLVGVLPERELDLIGDVGQCLAVGQAHERKRHRGGWPRQAQPGAPPGHRGRRGGRGRLGVRGAERRQAEAGGTGGQQAPACRGVSKGVPHVRVQPVSGWSCADVARQRAAIERVGQREFESIDK